jgi:hypothetical protein
MTDGSGSLGCRIFGIFLPVRIVRKRGAISHQSAARGGSQIAQWGWAENGTPINGEPFESRKVRTLQPRELINKENDMKKTLIIAAAAMLIGSSGLSFAGSATKGASGSAPGNQMNNSTTTTSRGASEFAPGDRTKDSSTTGMSKGASEFSPGDRMNDLRKKK